MKDIKVVIGAVFGDEGKGLMTDYYCKGFNNERVLNVRFNGSSQAGHTVVTSDGERHVFSHFGAGSFNKNVSTYLASTFYVNPVFFRTERESLIKKGISPTVYTSLNSPIVLPWDSIINMIIEDNRGKNRHGSCGQGVYEAVLRNSTNMSIQIGDILNDATNFRGQFLLKGMLKNIRDIWFSQKLITNGIDIRNTPFEDIFYSESLIDNFIQDLEYYVKNSFFTTDEHILNTFDKIVFEGAQGLLLDWDNVEYMPNLTASNTGLKNVRKLIDDITVKSSIEVCYVSRSYFTRHGAGEFATEVLDSNELTGNKLVDKTNKTNDWQEHFRYGYFDIDLFNKNIIKDLLHFKNVNYTKTLAITHMDETNNKVIIKNKRISFKDFKLIMNNFDNFITSHGETYSDVKNS